MEHFFPELNYSKRPLELTRHQWNLIRRRFGKPRRYFIFFILSNKKIFFLTDCHQNILKMKELNYLNNEIYFVFFNMKTKLIIHPKKSFSTIFHF
jgi:hypothetical protein